MFKKLFCKHKYRFYNTKVEYPFTSSCGYNVFQFVCPNCDKEIELSEYGIKEEYNQMKSKYYKKLALSKDPLGEPYVKTSSFSHSRHMDYDICYESPIATLMIEKYLKQGIDLRDLKNY